MKAKHQFLSGLFILFAIPLCAEAGSLQATGTDETVSVNITQNIVGPLGFDAGYVHNFVSSNELASIGLHMGMDMGPVGGQIGVKGFYTEVDDKNSKGYAPGIGLHITPIPTVTLGGSYYYADDQYSGDNDFKRYRDWSVTVNFQPLSVTNIFVGYGYKSVEMKGEDEVIMNEGPIVGVSLNY